MTDKDGNKRYTTEVVADEASFVERKSDSSSPSQGSIPMYGTPKNDDSFEELSADDELRSDIVTAFSRGKAPLETEFWRLGALFIYIRY